MRKVWGVVAWSLLGACDFPLPRVADRNQDGVALSFWGVGADLEYIAAYVID